MHDRPKPRPGSLPLPDYSAPPEPAPTRTPTEETPWIVARRSGYTMSEEELRPFSDALAENLRRRELEATFTALQKVRAKAEELAGVARTEAFDDWVRRCVVTADTPAEWTQARVLYESYIAHARRFGRTSSHRAQSVLALATETQWGRMMATLFPKKRRTAGWFYPLRCKRGG